MRYCLVEAVLSDKNCMACAFIATGADIPRIILMSKTIKFSSITLLLAVLMGAAKMAAAQQDPTVIVVGGEAGTPWQDGGGTIAPTTIESATRVEHSNTPGGVIDFEFPERANWIFPQRVDTTNNILLGFTSTERGGSLFSC